MGSSKRYLVAAGLTLLLGVAHADTGVISASGTGHDTPEAISNLLRTAVARHFRESNVALTRTILQTEILPNASSFVQSYKITEGGKNGSVTLSANVDLDVIQGLLGLTPTNIGEKEGAKALVLVRGPKLPDSLLASLKPGTHVDPFGPLLESGRERFFRREFTEARLTAEDLQAAAVGEDLSSPELLRGMGAKAGARVVLGVTGRFETYENENSHNKEERLVLSATMVDVKAGAVIGRSSAHVPNPKSRKEQYVADLQRNVLEESKELFQDVFVAAGRRLGKSENHSDFSVVRVLYPSNSVLVTRFKSMLETVPGVRSVVDFSVRRGKYDFAVRPAIPDAVLAKAVAALQSPELTVSAVEPLAAETEAHAPAVSVKLTPKETGTPEAEGGANANPAPEPRR